MADSDFGEIAALKYWTTEDNEDWFNVWWVDENRSSLQCRSNFAPGLKRYLDFVQQKGNGPKTRRTCCIGRRPTRSSGGREPVIGSPARPDGRVAAYETNVKVRFHSNDNSRCVPYAFLNATQSRSKQKGIVMAAFSSGGWFGGLPDLARAVGKIGWHLSKIDRKAGDPEAGSRPVGSRPTRVDWVLRQKSGCFLLVDDVHCVAVDCSNGLLWDCSERFALRLCSESLRSCGIVKITQIRRIWHR
jgi:hypothetical protein